MKRAKQLVWGIILSMLLSIPVYAAETFEIGISEVKIAENVMEMQVANNLADASKAVTYEVNLDGKALPLLSVDSVKNTGYGTSYIFLVDISGSMKKAVMEDVKSILSSLVNEMQANDNACLMLVGDDAYSGEFSKDKNALLAEIEAIEKLHEDTNLYLGIDQALDILDTNSQVLNKKCLVILSDGEDDQITGITKEEVEKKIEEKHITICSIATIGENPSEKKQESAKIIGSFARMSPGGIHTLFVGEEANAENAAKQIVNNNTGSVVIKADVTEFAAEAADVYLEVVATVDGIGTAKNGYNIPAANIKKGLVEVETEPETETVEETVEETTTEAVEETTEETATNYIWIVAAVVLLTAVVIILIIMNNKKKQKLEEEEAKKAAEKKAAEEKALKDENKEGVTIEPLTVINEQQEDFIKEEKKPALKVTLVKIGLAAKEEKELSITDTFVIGRKAEKCDMAFADDTMISQRHFQFINDNGKLAIEDLDSLNGTLVNGALIKQRFYLVSGDIVTFGNNEWRILVDGKETED